MDNPYNLEQAMIEREREIKMKLAHDALVKQLGTAPSVATDSRELPIRTRFGLFLIRLGTSLAA